MGAPYSEDLRWRVLAAVDGGMSKWRVHQTFRVSRTTIDDWLKLRAETGGIEAKTEYYRGRAPMVADTRELRAFLAAHEGKTLAQLTAAWEAATGQAVSVKTFHKTLQHLLSPRSVQVAHRSLYWTLKQAVAWELIGRNVLEAVRVPKQNKPEIACWTSNEVLFVS